MNTLVSFDGSDGGLSNPQCQDSPSTVGLATPLRAASPLATNRVSETPRAGRSPSLSTAELPEEPGASPSSGAATPKVGQSEGGTSTLSRYSKLSLGFPPLPGFFRSRNSPTTPKPPAKFTTDTTEEPQESGAFLDVLSNPLEVAEPGRAGKPDDDDDRRTIKGVIVETAEQSVTSELKQGDNGQIPNGAASAGEKLPPAMSLSTVSTVVPMDSFV